MRERLIGVYELLARLGAPDAQVVWSAGDLSPEEENLIDQLAEIAVSGGSEGALDD